MNQINFLKASVDQYKVKDMITFPLTIHRCLDHTLQVNLQQPRFSRDEEKVEVIYPRLRQSAQLVGHPHPSIPDQRVS